MNDLNSLSLGFPISSTKVSRFWFHLLMGQQNINIILGQTLVIICFLLFVLSARYESEVGDIGGNLTL